MSQERFFCRTTLRTVVSIIEELTVPHNSNVLRVMHAISRLHALEFGACLIGVDAIPMI